MLIILLEFNYNERKLTVIPDDLRFFLFFSNKIFVPRSFTNKFLRWFRNVMIPLSPVLKPGWNEAISLITKSLDINFTMSSAGKSVRSASFIVVVARTARISLGLRHFQVFVFKTMMLQVIKLYSVVDFKKVLISSNDIMKSFCAQNKRLCVCPFQSCLFINNQVLGVRENRGIIELLCDRK